MLLRLRNVPAGVLGGALGRADGLLLPFEPGLPPLVRRLRIACAPKLILRVNGVVGAVRAMSSSSMAFSSMASELFVDMLPRRRPP
jgi:hypothetical protein